jgi:polysaccharide export outer membrane protein
MSRTVHHISIYVLFMSLLFCGCASSGSKATVVPKENTPRVQPVASEYILGVGDSLDITVWRNDDLKTSTKINPTGTIMFPLIGEVQAAGRSISALRDDLKARFSKYLVNPQITISVSSIQSQKVLVLGEVKSPGVFSLDTELTIMDAVTKAGGWSNDANMSKVILLRNVSGQVEIQSIDLTAVLEGRERTDNMLLQKNDIVFIPTKKIADVSRLMKYISSILSPVVSAEAAIVLWPQMINAINGKSTGGSTIVTQ